jgi:hypothetical protein
MAETYDPILTPTFEQERCGLVWLRGASQNEEGKWADWWLLVQSSTDRVVATIDGTTDSQLTFDVCLEGGSRRKYISLEGAKRNAIACAMQILADEGIHKARNRKMRHERKKARA